MLWQSRPSSALHGLLLRGTHIQIAFACSQIAKVRSMVEHAIICEMLILQYIGSYSKYSKMNGIASLTVSIPTKWV